MTDRINALTVVLETDMRDDDVAGLIAAIQHLRGVLSVESHVVDIGAHVAKQQAQAYYRAKLWEALKE